MLEFTEENIPTWTLVVSIAALLLTTYTATMNVTRQKKANLEIERVRIKREMKVAAYDKISPSLLKLLGFVEDVHSSAITRHEIKEALEEMMKIKESYTSRKHLFSSKVIVNEFEVLVHRINKLTYYIRPYYHDGKGQVVFPEEEEQDLIIPTKESLIRFETLLHRDVFDEINKPPRKWYQKLWNGILSKGRR
jgi:hypothetical protein